MALVDSSNPPPKRIVLTTFGSLGDLHPYIAIALGLQARGHEAVIATSEYYRQKIDKLGIGFRPVRPDFPDPIEFPDIIRQIMDLRGGGKFVIREMMMPVLRESYEDTLAAAAGADLLVSHILTFTTPLVAEKRNIPWVGTYLQPFGQFSAYDPPVLPPAQFLAKLRFLGPWLHRVLFWCARKGVRSWSKPWHRLRAEIGLPPSSQDPLFKGAHSPWLVLSLFSRLLAAPQPDWPPHSVSTGFPFYDQDGEAGLSTELLRFLDSGPPPLVFTLGSSAVKDAGLFYEQSATAAKLLGRRAVLLVGRDTQNRPRELPDGVAAFDYAPFSELFPRAAAIVHQGGIGTTAQAMRSGRPMLVMPYAHDQPDNAYRVTKLGIARTIPRRRYTAERAALEIRELLDEPLYAQRASEIGEKVRQEDGVRAACDALEEVLH
ncbi:MAG TPA: nucleotide disphospho-sugar-binding domain-containing protein [Gemmataceae bacterium]|jgi:UDP:flavonoid glycosyltransferase YjiC (YdhE family)|nr:nucleotide disphospho-sugar-binding domain-containing protein [Gemmataceae bacterium]